MSAWFEWLRWFPIRSLTGSGLGSVAVGGSVYYEVLGIEPVVVAPADGDEIVDIGGSSVSVPFLHVVEFASMHGGAAFEASAVPDGDRQSLGGVSESLVATQPEGTALPVEDHAGQLRVRGEGLENLAGYRADADDLDLPVGEGDVSLLPFPASTRLRSSRCLALPFRVCGANTPASWRISPCILATPQLTAHPSGRCVMLNILKNNCY